MLLCSYELSLLCAHTEFMIRHCVVDHDKLTWTPSVDACVLIHELFEVPDYFLGQISTVSEGGFFAVLFFRGGPADDLIIKDLVAVRANLDGIETLRYDLTVSVVKPLPGIVVFLQVDFSFFSGLDMEQ